MANSPTWYQAEAYVSFDQCDSAGVIFYPRLIEWAHRSIENALRDQDLHQIWFQNETLAAPVVQVAARFFKPLALGDHVIIHLAVEEVKTHSLSFRCSFQIDDAVHASVESVHVFIDKASRTKAPIPPAILERFK